MDKYIFTHPEVGEPFYTEGDSLTAAHENLLRGRPKLPVDGWSAWRRVMRPLSEREKAEYE